MNFKQLCEMILSQLCENPVNCHYFGIERNLGALPRPDRNSMAKSLAKIKMLQRLLGEIDPNTLDFDNKIDHEIARLVLEKEELSFNLEIDGVRQINRMPKAADSISSGLFMLLVNDNREPKYRLANIISKLEEIPRYIQDLKKNVRGPVERWVKMDVAQCKELPELFQTICRWAVEIGFSQLEDRLKKAVEVSEKALMSWISYLESLDTTESVFLGKEQTLKVIKSRGIDLSPEELHEMAKEFTKKNTLEIEKLRAKLCTKHELPKNTNSGSLQKILNKKYETQFVQRDEKSPFQGILDRYELEKEKILKFVEERNLFPIMDDQEIEIIQTPAYFEPSIPAGAMIPALPFRIGTKKSIVYLTLSEALLPEHTEISIPMMMIHEGIPGHHLQFSWAASNSSVMRRVIDANDLAEGWTTMLEDYMLDIGYGGELETEIRFIGKREIGRIGARVAIDLYFMSGEKKYLEIGVDFDRNSNDPFVLAGNLLREVTGFVDARIEGELNWYSQERGYPLSYLTGNQLVWSLKKEMISKLHGKKSETEIDKIFHKEFLEAGNMPVRLLREVFKEKRLI